MIFFGQWTKTFDGCKIETLENLKRNHSTFYNQDYKYGLIDKIMLQYFF